MHQGQLLLSAIDEYECLLATMGDETTQAVRSVRLIDDLHRAHDWTDDGARAIVSLANDYGAFVLRNALALAVALGKEDGELGL